MIELLTNNWLWIVLGIGAIWLLTRMAGAGCGMGGHSHREEASRGPQSLEASAGEQAEAAHRHGGGTADRPRRRGCC